MRKYASHLIHKINHFVLKKAIIWSCNTNVYAVTKIFFDFLSISRMKNVEYEWVQDMAEYEQVRR